MTDSGAPTSFATQRQREGRREELAEQREFIALLAEHLDPACTFWTSLENKPRSPVSGVFAKLRGVKSGLPDVIVIQRRPRRLFILPRKLLVVFVELKSRRGLASNAQKQIRAEMLPAGAVWYMARSARAALTALYRAGMTFRQRWTPPELEPWEGPFTDPHRRLPQEPTVAAERRAGTKAWRERQRARKAAEQQRREFAAAPKASEPLPCDHIPPHAGLLFRSGREP